MTPTLIGRWQTRTFAAYGRAGGHFFFALLAAFLFEELDFLKPFAILFFVLVTGYVWDAVYIFCSASVGIVTGHQPFSS